MRRDFKLERQRKRWNRLTPQQKAEERRHESEERQNTARLNPNYPPRGYQPAAGGRNPKPLPWESR